MSLIDTTPDPDPGEPAPWESDTWLDDPASARTVPRRGAQLEETDRRAAVAGSDPFAGMSVTEVLRALDETSLATRFVSLHRDRLRVVAGAWMVWCPVERDSSGDAVAGGHWDHAEDGARAEYLATELMEELRTEVHSRIDALSAIIDGDRRNADARKKRGELISAATRLGTDRTVRAVVRIAKRHPELNTDAKAFDADPMLLNCVNGTIDLTTGELRPHSVDDLITHRVAVTYDRAAKCPTWLGVLDDVFCGDSELVSWFQRAVGYSITGDTSAQVLFFLYGSGSNGKSTVTNTIRDLLGDGLYQKVKATALMASTTAGHAATPEVAKLRGARVAVASELPAARFDEATIKDIVGEDDVTARFLNGNPFTWTPTHKLWMFGNHRPTITGTDQGIWRRMRLVPFRAKFEGDAVIPDLPLRLSAEMSGILTWAVEGSLEWSRLGGGKKGLGKCAAVDTATAAYRVETDTIGEFIDEMCLVGPDREVRARVLYRAYSQWARDSGHGVQSMTKFGLTLEERGFSKRRSSGIIRTGLSLTPEAEYATAAPF